MDATFRDATLKGHLWEDVSRKLADLGYKRSAKKCKEKFENVHKYYKRTKEGRTGRQDGKSYRFFDELEALHAAAPQPQPPLQKQQQQLPPASTTAPPLHAFAAPVSAPPPISSMPPPTGPMQPAPISSAAPAGQVQTLVELPGAHQPLNLLQGFSFSSMSESESEGDDMTAETGGSHDRLGKRKRGGDGGSGSKKTMSFFEGLMQQVVDRQEEMQRRFLETMETLESGDGAHGAGGGVSQAGGCPPQPRAGAARSGARRRGLQGRRHHRLPPAHRRAVRAAPYRRCRPNASAGACCPYHAAAKTTFSSAATAVATGDTAAEANLSRAAPAAPDTTAAQGCVAAGRRHAAQRARDLWPVTRAGARRRPSRRVGARKGGVVIAVAQDGGGRAHPASHGPGHALPGDGCQGSALGGHFVRDAAAGVQPELEAVQGEVGEHQQVLQEGEGEQQEAARGLQDLPVLPPARGHLHRQEAPPQRRRRRCRSSCSRLPRSAELEPARDRREEHQRRQEEQRGIRWRHAGAADQQWRDSADDDARRFRHRHRHEEARRHHQDVKRAPASGVHHGGRNGQRRVHRRRGGRRGRRQNAVQDTVPEAEPRRHHNQHRTSTASDDACTSGADFGSDQRLPCHGSIGARAAHFSNRTYTRSNPKKKKRSITHTVTITSSLPVHQAPSVHHQHHIVLVHPVIPPRHSIIY
ncbi:GT-2-like 1 [Zea mays]|uniref:GT-2-like 1 n=1 Tax=Zea mays TaxID=4577 RepID=A0A1D6JBA0_MAIZE|nr:GT-2-like 1 [Zea mays]